MVFDINECVGCVTDFWSIFALMSLARMRKASSTPWPVLALVSMNLMPCSAAS